MSRTYIKNLHQRNTSKTYSSFAEYRPFYKMSRLLKNLHQKLTSKTYIKNIQFFCRISSLSQGYFAKETSAVSTWCASVVDCYELMLRTDVTNWFYISSYWFICMQIGRATCVILRRASRWRASRYIYRYISIYLAPLACSWPLLLSAVFYVSSSHSTCMWMSRRAGLCLVGSSKM